MEKIKQTSMITGSICIGKDITVLSKGVTITPRLKRGINFVSLGLGYIKGKEVDNADVHQNLNRLGLVLLDDVDECFGEKTTEILIEHLRKKYEEPSNK